MSLLPLIVGAVVATAPGPQQPVPMLSGMFQLPTLCASKSAFEETAALMKQPSSPQRDEKIFAIHNTQCQTAPAQSGFIIERMEGQYALVEVIDINVNRQPSRVSKGLWWVLTEDIQRMRFR